MRGLWYHTMNNLDMEVDFPGTHLAQQAGRPLALHVWYKCPQKAGE